MKKVKGLIIMLLISLSLFGMTACGGQTENPSTYEQITAQQAKTIMDEIKDRAEKELPDKEQLILVYCRSGRRSKIASEELVKLGYTNVKEFGGIIDWPYDIVK